MKRICLKFWICLLFTIVAYFSVHAQPIKAAWLTNSGSKLMYSRDGIRQAVQLAKRAGLTHLCPVVWNKGYTQYKSAVMQQYFGIALDPSLHGFDPLQALITEAHKEGIQVIAWFEFGFAAAYLDSGMHVLRQYPHWAARTVDGGLVTVNQFTWMNSFHPEVQDFLTAIVTEVVSTYDVDGIQGDDRMPAAPALGGYDAYTVSRYREVHAGAYPPAYHEDSAWLQWRANLLTEWCRQLYAKVKSIKPAIMVAHAPSIFPWSKEHYLQDWPAWLRQGSTDIIMPQVYRYNLAAYKTALNDALRYAHHYESKLYPGILAALGNGFTMPANTLQQMIEYNRQKGIKGEAFFYMEALQRNPAFFMDVYPALQ